MSKFFQSKTYTEIDDSSYSFDSTWSSNRIVTEIKNRKADTRLSELKDVDTNNIKDGYILTYSKDSDMWITSPLNSIGDGSGYHQMQQYTKFGVNGTLDNPEIIRVPINTVDFKIPRVNVLKLMPGVKDIIVTKSDFDSSEKEQYIEDNFIEFNGTAHLKIDGYGGYMEFHRDLDDKKEWGYQIDKKDFKKYIEFSTDYKEYPSLYYKAIPHDRILVQKTNFNLSSVENIDYFELIGNGNNIRIMVSNNDGCTWFYFNGTEFMEKELNLENIKQYGNTIEQFNQIKERWNYITNTKKLRFAYLLQQDDIDHPEELDKLILQFDGNGKWRQVSSLEYDVEVSNTEMTVYLYCQGDIKINY